MPDFSNIVFIVIALVVFIGRALLQARKKKEPPPRVHIPVHFEDDEKPRIAAASAAAAKPVAPKAVKRHLDQPMPPPLSTQAAAAPPEKAGEALPKAAPQERKGFSLNLSHLSPLKQAVVMAEILGTPKGM